MQTQMVDRQAQAPSDIPRRKVALLSSAASPHSSAPRSGAVSEEVAGQPGWAVLTERRTALLTGLSVRSLQRHRIAGTGIPFIQLGPRRIGYRMCDVQAWLDGRRFASTSAATVARDQAA
jgi:hypothetical protein